MVWGGYTSKGKGKGRYSSSWEPHLRATGRHLPIAIWDHTVLPANRHQMNVPCQTPAIQAGSRTRCTYPRGIEG